MVEIKENVLTADEFIRLYNSVGWCAPAHEQVKNALEHSLHTFSLYNDGNLAGMVRLLGDMSMTYYVKEFVIFPEAQAHGFGRMLMERINDYIAKQLPKGWAASLELMSADGKEGFYEKFGFERRPCEHGGAGMFRMIRN